MVKFVSDGNLASGSSGVPSGSAHIFVCVREREGGGSEVGVCVCVCVFS